MALPLKQPVLPQLARSRESLPDGEGWAYEVKYDGFRCVAFVDGGEVELQSRNGKTLTRYFPEVAASFPDGRFVFDGEIVAASFDTLGQRIHPAKSRVERLSVETPARFIAFDLLARDDEVLLALSYDERRAALEDVDGVEVAPVVRSAAEAEGWLATEEGVIAKQTGEPYRPGERVGMVKVKRVRTADCVVMGWRPGKAEGTLGAIILGMYDGDRLREVGHSSGFTAKQKKELPAMLAPYETGERGSGEPSRWNSSRPPRDLQWVALRPELVVEITFDHTSDGRIRHGAKVQRWREDKPARECTYDQLED
jgi:ATP-dependent DNA ligase